MTYDLSERLAKLSQSNQVARGSYPRHACPALCGVFHAPYMLYAKARQFWRALAITIPQTIMQISCSIGMHTTKLTLRKNI